jgi:hypothetical protein
MSRALNDLHPKFKPIAIELIARIVEAKIAVMIIDTLRTPAEHAANLANGTSSTTRSKHLDGLAIDLCPYEIYSINGPDKLYWNTDAPEWFVMGKIGESLGLRWGGRWKKPHDPGHFEYVGKL